jgi:predicted metal-dependent phosphoesterase TrpH
VAITDHDSVAALPEADEAARALGIQLVPGAELTAYAGSREVHLLAYFATLATARSDAFTRMLASVQDARKKRVREAVRQLRLRGVLISDSEVFRGPSQSWGRLHLAQAIVNAGFARTVNEAFTKFLHDGAGTVPALDVAPEQVVRHVRDLGGVVVWAHPSPEDFARLGPRLTAAGIDGLETHNFRRADTAGRLTAAARDHGLLASGGSDWHGTSTEAALGVHAVGSDLAEPLLEAISRRAA